MAYRQPFARSERHPSNSGKSTILYLYRLEVSISKLLILYGLKQVLVPVPLLPVSGFLEVRHLEDLSLYIYIYIYVRPTRSYQHVSEDTKSSFSPYILYNYTHTDDFKCWGVIVKCLHFQSPSVCVVRAPLSVVPLFGTRGIRSFVVPCTMLQHPGPTKP